MRFLIVDQFDISREGMKAVLSQMDEDSTVLEATSIEEITSLSGAGTFDLIIINLDVPNADYIDALVKVERLDKKDNIIIFTSSGDISAVRRAYKMGVGAFICEQMKKEVIISVFQVILAGGKYFSPEIIGQPQDKEKQNIISKFSLDRDGRPILSNRQFDVLKLLAEGKPNQIVAHELNIAIGTVKVHVAGILKSLNATNRTHAVTIARKYYVL